ncbi:unnamed protein product [Adineta steineri]|uniref:Ubiquitin carboxyl-terminal hydrolase MINDY n=1 Tax=Adineta steineri TaxID=433720 RepID=A0A813QGZ1_9BILA|nr:unnamed protein product [Adineta steineri]
MPTAGPNDMPTSEGQSTMYRITTENSDGEYSDQDLLSLVNYFEVSRAELKNRVDSLLAQPILKAKQVDTQAPKLFEGKQIILLNVLKDNRILDEYIKNYGNSRTLKLYSQGDPITLPIASTLRLLANNSTIHSFSEPWLSAKFSFRDYTNPLNYGLIADRTGARGVILSVQAFVIRHLLLKNLLSPNKHRSISVSIEARNEALVDAITEILCQAGERRGATVSVPYAGDECFSNYGVHYTLRLLANNSTIHSFSEPWLSAKFSFRDYTNPLNYGLVADRTGARGLILSVQAFVIRHLLLKNLLSPNKHRSISVSIEARNEALVDAITEILWQAGERRGATVSVPYAGDECFSNYGVHYVPDGITERLHMFEFVDIAKLRTFIIKCLPYFMKENGVIVFLYSLMLSRTLKKLIDDLDHTRLLGDRDESTIQMVTLALTGRALHYFHNGVIDVDSDGNLMEHPQYGVKDRCSVGFIYWSKHEDDGFYHKQETGSMLRTPKVPVWLVCLNRRYGIMFSTNINLLNNWIYENYFQLHIYTGLKKQEEPCLLSIDTREQYPASIYGNFFEDTDQFTPDFIQLLQTRWAGCKIENADEVLHDLMTYF